MLHIEAMDSHTWFLAHGETVHSLAFGMCLRVMAERARPQPARRQEVPRAERWRANFTLMGLNPLALRFVPTSFIAAAPWAKSRGLGVEASVTLVFRSVWWLGIPFPRDLSPAQGDAGNAVRPAAGSLV